MDTLLKSYFQRCYHPSIVSSHPRDSWEQTRAILTSLCGDIQSVTSDIYSSQNRYLSKASNLFRSYLKSYLSWKEWNWWTITEKFVLFCFIRETCRYLNGISLTTNMKTTSAVSAFITICVLVSWLHLHRVDGGGFEHNYVGDIIQTLLMKHISYSHLKVLRFA